jgi:hypothetical protein
MAAINATTIAAEAVIRTGMADDDEDVVVLAASPDAPIRTSKEDENADIVAVRTQPSHPGMAT